MEHRRFGKLEHMSSVLVYGGAALGEVDQDTADRSIQQALDAGVNHFDFAASYGDAELRLGPWTSRIRGDIFLATKTGDRDRDGAWASINRSLERMQTDHIDLIQLHAIGDLAELDLAMGTDGAIHAAVRAQEEGIVGAIGITGHGTQAAQTHLEALRRFPFASVLTPLNPLLWRDETYRAAYLALVEEIRRQDVGLRTIKTVSRRNWPEGSDQTYSTWYEPFDEAEKIRAAVSWTLAHEEITGLALAGDVRLIGMEIAAERERMDATDAEAALLHEPDYSSPFIHSI